MEKLVESLPISNIEAIANMFGFTATTEVDNADGPYIVHVGQIHGSPYENRDTVDDMKKIVDFQKNLEQLILSFQSTDASIDSVFDEGQTDGLSYKDVENKFETAFDQRVILHEGTSCADLEDLYEQILGRLGEDPSSDVVRSIFNHSYERAITRMVTRLQQDNPGVDYSVFRHEALSKIRNVVPELGGDDAYYFLGAVNHLFLDGKINIIATENHNDQLKDLQAQQKSLNEQIKQNPPNRIDLITRFLEINDVMKDMVYSDRERDAVQKIIQSPTFSDKKINLLVFGNGHSFAKAVTDSNNKNPDHLIGLIKLSPKE